MSSRNPTCQFGFEWHELPIYGDPNRGLSFVRVCKWEEPSIEVGMTRSKNWIGVGKSSVFRIEEGCPFVLPLLELRFEELRRKLRSGLRRQGLPLEAEGWFPFETVVLLGLNSGSEFWTGLSLERVKEVQPSQRLLIGLDECSRMGPTQKLRHLAKKRAADLRRQFI